MKHGFSWTQYLWAMTLILWIVLGSYKMYDWISSESDSQQEDSETGLASSPELTDGNTLPSFDKNWKGYSRTKTKIPRIKDTRDD
jgi:hypothetical protein